LIQVMEFCFSTFWKDKIESQEDKKWILHSHLNIYWDWLKHLWAGQPQLKDLNPKTTPDPSCWKWEGFMAKEKAALAEKAAET